jgi:phosphatidylglycerophosphate synthase
MTEAATPEEQRGHEAERTPSFLLARWEKPTLIWIANRLPTWVMPDQMTLLGVLAAFGIGACYMLSNNGSEWLWAVNALLVVQWFGDSLDGTLARVRKIERPKYGYYLDHLVDAVATAAIGIGLGLSPYMLLSTGMLIVIVYLILSINVYLEAQTLGKFSLGYGYLGPTEGRVVLFVINALLALGVGLDFTIGDLGLTAFDIVGMGAAGIMILALAGRAIRNLRQLALEEPSGRKRAEGATSASR